MDYIILDIEFNGRKFASDLPMEVIEIGAVRLDLSSREGAEGQVKAHVQGNVNVGNGKETLITAITHCLPYIGFPRTLNALASVNEIIPEV